MVRTIVALLLISGAVQADTLYRCVGKGGAVAYQAQACGEQAKQTGTVEFTPERVPAYRPLPASRSSSNPSTRTSKRSGSATGALIPIEAGGKACETAKSRREKKLAQVGLKRNYDLLQKLDEDVRRACDG